MALGSALAEYSRLVESVEPAFRVYASRLPKGRRRRPKRKYILRASLIADSRRRRAGLYVLAAECSGRGHGCLEDRVLGVFKDLDRGLSESRIVRKRLRVYGAAASILGRSA